MASGIAKHPPYVHAWADVSGDGVYRYTLGREWRGTHDRQNWDWWGFQDGVGADVGEPKSVLFIMLNPSTADGELDDPTIRRCVAFAKAWKYERMEVVNLYAYRASSPKVLWATDSDKRVGDRNTEVIKDAAHDAALIVCAWGANGERDRDHVETVRGWLGDKPQWALGLTNSGQPKHPLYVPTNTKLVRMPR